MKTRILPLTSVGSFPKPDYVLKARKQYPAGHPDRKKLERRATKFWIEIQESLNYDILVHGEMERGDMVAYFGETLGGLEPGNPKEPVRAYGNRFWIPPEIKGRVFWKGPMTVESWKYAQSITSKPVKGMLTGPGTIYDWSIDIYYGNRRRALKDIAQALREEIKALISSGAKIIQIDEPSLAQAIDISYLKNVFVDMLKGLDAYFIFHTCYGEEMFKKYRDDLARLPIHNLDIETANSDMRLLNFIGQVPFDITVGLVDVHSHETESKEIVIERIRKALETIPRNNLWLGPDCGLKTRTVQEAIDKLAIISKARDTFLKQ
ncbi:MAG: cobalamin-independent methionine synthase II family protein [bacterium]|nr:cobalamin-independent methionine synthase II family protein [bacterium]